MKEEQEEEAEAADEGPKTLEPKKNLINSPFSYQIIFISSGNRRMMVLN